MSDLSAADLERLLGLIGGGPAAIITGAGLSTESGIPAYRDRDGQWLHAQPIQHREFLARIETRRRYWARSFAGWPAIAQALPNRGHRAIARLEARGVLLPVITQNVDGLHPAAGSEAAIELHGGIRHVRCLGCGQRFTRHEVQHWLAAANPGFCRDADSAGAARTLPDGDALLADTAHAGFAVPDCPHCGGMLKPDVVFFGDSVPADRVQAARRTVESAAALLVAGSSLMVYSGYRFAELAHRLGKPVIAINRGVTRADPLLSLKVDADCGAVLAAVAQRLAADAAEPVWHLYLLECADGSYYTGVTTDVARRFAQHLGGKAAHYTRSHKPLRVLASRAIGSRSEALKAEAAVKRLPRDAKPAAVAVGPITAG